MKNIYVGNLGYDITPEELCKMFQPYGVLKHVVLPRDTVTGRARGFAFVEMADDGAAAKAIRGLNGSTHSGRTIVVNEAHAKAGPGGARRGNGERRFGRG